MPDSTPTPVAGISWRQAAELCRNQATELRARAHPTLLRQVAADDQFVLRYLADRFDLLARNFERLPALADRVSNAPWWLMSDLNDLRRQAQQAV